MQILTGLLNVEREWTKKKRAPRLTPQTPKHYLKSGLFASLNKRILLIICYNDYYKSKDAEHEEFHTLNRMHTHRTRVIILLMMLVVNATVRTGKRYKYARAIEIENGGSIYEILRA